MEKFFTVNKKFYFMVIILFFAFIDWIADVLTIGLGL